MNNKFEDKHSDDPDYLTTEDREVMKKKILNSTDIKNALNDRKVGEAITSSRRFPETGPKLIFGILLIISGVIIAVVTSISIIGIIIGAAMVIGGIILPFSNLGGTNRHPA
jgi:small-conductance mechanosensitive channel